MSSATSQSCVRVPRTSEAPRPERLRSASRRRGRIRGALVLTRVLERHSTREAARALDINESSVREMRSGSCSLAWGDLWELPRPLALDLLDEARSDLAPLERTHLAPERHALCVEREWGDVCRELEAALADGRIDAAERARVARELRQVRERVDAMLADLEAAS